jgi:hypothetical protein
MKCLNFRHLLDEHLDGSLDAETEARFLHHAAACAACDRLREDGLRLQWALGALPVPAPDAGFADRVLLAACREQAGGARRATRSAWGWPGALAAGLALALGVGFWTPRETMPEVVAGAEPLRLVFRSEGAVDGVTIELELPEGVELAGYPGQRSLVWQSDLVAGENLLELPVRATGAGGVVRATLNHDGERRQFAVRVVTAPAAAGARRGTESAMATPDGEADAHA